MNSATDVWEKVKSLMEADMTAVAIETWFGDTEAVALEDTRMVLCVPSEFKRNIIREMTQLSLAEIGQLFGGRHHSTVLNSIDRVEKTIKEQPEMGEIIRDITNAVNSAY